MTISDWMMIIAVITSPAIAVQIDKLLDKKRLSDDKKLDIYKTIMRNRANHLDKELVKALNEIDLEFSDEKYALVREKWNEYLNHLYDEDFSERDLHGWTDKGQEYFTDLAYVMGKSLGYKFDKVHIKKATYLPRHFETQFFEDIMIKRKLLETLHGDTPVKIVLVEDTEKSTQ